MGVGRRTAGSDIDGGRRSTGSDIDVGRRSEGGMEFGGFRLQLTPKPVEAAAGRQWYNFAPSRLARSARAVMSSGPDRGSDFGRNSGPDRRRTKDEPPSRRSSSPASFRLSELAALAGMADDETVHLARPCARSDEVHAPFRVRLGGHATPIVARFVLFTEEL